MLRDFLSSRLIQVGIVFCVIVVGGSLLYSWHVQRRTAAEFERYTRFREGVKSENETRTTAETSNGSDFVDTPEEAEDVQMSDATAASPVNETSEFADVADAFLSDDVILEKSPAETEDVLVSPYGFGPYPELPEGWPSSIWPRDSAKTELITRVQIKLAHQGINALGGIMENGLVYPAIPGTVYVDWKERSDGSRFISDMTGDPESADVLQSLMESKGRDFTEMDIPSDMELLPFSGGGIDPYDFLDLPSR